MNIKRLNSLYQLTQAVQLSLLSVQGILIILDKTNSFYLPLWIGLAILSVFQVSLIFKYPQAIEVKQLTNRSAMFKLRLMALLPYALILVGLLLVR